MMFDVRTYPKTYISNLHAPRIKAAVPVHTPLQESQSTTQFSHQALALDIPKEKRKNSHQPLQRRKLDGLDPLPQPRDLLLDPGLRLLDAHILPIRLLADPPLLEVQIQPHGRLRTADLVAEAVGELGQVGGEPVVRGARELRLGAI